jgi:hypothetical protein
VTQAVKGPVRPGWRFNLGVGLFALGLICPVFVPLVAATDLEAEWKATLSGALLLGLPEVLWLTAAMAMGKPGFEYLKHRVWRLFKRHALPRTVSRTRYRIGLGLFVVPLLLGWLAPYVPGAIPDSQSQRVVLALAFDVLFLVSLLVLGGDFWDKLTALFVHRARAQFPDAGPGRT